MIFLFIFWKLCVFFSSRKKNIKKENLSNRSSHAALATMFTKEYIKAYFLLEAWAPSPSHRSCIFSPWFWHRMQLDNHKKKMKMHLQENATNIAIFPEEWFKKNAAILFLFLHNHNLGSIYLTRDATRQPPDMFYRVQVHSFREMSRCIM